MEIVKTQMTLWEYIRHCDGLDDGDMKTVTKRIEEFIGLEFRKNSKGYNNEKFGIGINLEKTDKEDYFRIKVTDTKGREMIFPTIANMCEMIKRALTRSGKR